MYGEHEPEDYDPRPIGPVRAAFNYALGTVIGCLWLGYLMAGAACIGAYFEIKERFRPVA